jgi:hypothetical protein
MFGKNMKNLFIILIAFLLLYPLGITTAQEAGKEQAYAGEFFGVPVPLSNYYFIKSVLSVFGNKWGANPQTPEEMEDNIWNDLLLSYEAFRMNVVVSESEIEEEVNRILKQEKVSFDRKKDSAAYADWVKAKTGEVVELFEHQVGHLLQLQKLRKQVMDGIKPEVKDEEAHQEFLNEQNNLSVELIQFDKLKDAEELYRKAKSNPKFWDDEKVARPNDFKRPGFVTLEFLIDIWRIPKDAAYEMMKKKIGEIYPARPVYKGFAVFKILEQRPVNETDYSKLKDSYYEQIRSRKKYAGFDEWLRGLKQKANIKIYKMNQ